MNHTHSLAMVSMGQVYPQGESSKSLSASTMFAGMVAGQVRYVLKDAMEWMEWWREGWVDGSIWVNRVRRERRVRRFSKCDVVMSCLPCTCTLGVHYHQHRPGPRSSILD
jgi:hypothetical protein